jgi:putative Mg2+ transporter-C (MgtC) family protein
VIIEWEMAMRLLLSCILGGFIGYERESHHKAAGLRTHILVSIGSCLIMVLSIKIYHSVEGFTNADPARLAAQVVSGIGFLGAGSIIKDGPTVRGLTTAASLWVVAGVGLAVGSGYYMGAFMTTGLVFLTLAILSRFENKDYHSLVDVVINTIDRPGQIGEIGLLLGKHNIKIRDIKMDGTMDQLTITFRIGLPTGVDMNEITISLLNIDGVSAVNLDP